MINEAIAAFPLLSTLLLGVLLDRVIGEPPRYHPLVGFGRLARWLEYRYQQGETAAQRRRAGLLAGLLAVVLIAAPVAALLAWLLAQPPLFLLLSAALLYWAIGARSLEQHALLIYRELQRRDLPAARAAVARIVSRDCSALDEEGVAKAASESVLENGSDALFAPLFWFVVAGPLAVLVYRLVNTLDAMWGYRNERYLDFGRFVARFDDLLNWLPARCCALSYALVGNTRQALWCWQQQAKHCESPNAGPVMAAGAGALGAQLGGAASYHGTMHWRPQLGAGARADATTIAAALQLIQRALLLWLLLIVLLEWQLGCWWIAGGWL